MKRFRGLDGLRGWLAWTVVIYHVSLFTGAQTAFGLRLLEKMGTGSVTVFIILSGFVITHLLIKKPEPYRLYITRRFLRIYPIYVIALAAGIASTFLFYSAILGADGTAAHATQTVFHIANLDRRELDLKELAGSGIYKYVALHLLMLHGVVSNTVLPSSQVMFLGPAWSLSLEWQFYLVAPLVIWAARRRVASIILAVVCIVLYKLYVEHRVGEFYFPSFLPGAVLYFAVGIVSRLLIGRSWGSGSWLALALLLAYAIRVRPDWEAAAIWVAFFGLSLIRPGASSALHSIDRAFTALFDSRLAKHFGDPSYSTYLLHMPILHLAMYLCIRVLHVTTGQGYAFTAVFTIGFTYLLSQAAFRWVELPGIKLGKRMAAKAGPGDIESQIVAAP